MNQKKETKQIIKKLLFTFIFFFGLFIVSSATSPFSFTSFISFTTSTSFCGNVEVVLTPSTGIYGEEIKVYINISNNQCEMCYFGFDLFYETSMFSFQGIERENCLTSDWSTVDGYEITPGQVRVGGFAGSASCIQPTENGCLVKVKLKVTCQCGVCPDGQQSTITIDSYWDQLESYEPQPAQGIFTFICCCGDISLPTDKAGTWGDKIHIPVNIANNDNQICDFGFDFVFDPSVFDFKEIEKCAAIQDWSTVEWSQIEPGKIRIEGFVGSGTCISPMSAVCLVTMKVMVKCVGYTVDTSIPIKIQAYTDGIACLCPRSFETNFLYKTCPRLGDVNEDGNVTPGDAQMAFEIYLGMITPTFCQLTTSDANCSCPCNCKEHTEQNNCITPGDAQRIFEHYLGKIVIPLCCTDYQCPESSGMIHGEASIPSFEKRVVYALPSIGNSGERVMIPVMVNNPEGIRSFSLEMVYPQELLEYVGLLASPLAQGFEYVRGEEEVPGVVKIEGKGEQGITGREAGSLGVVVFNVRKGINGSAPVVLLNLGGDIFRADAESSIFVRAKHLKSIERSLTLGESRERGGMLVVPVKVTNAFDVKAFGLEVKYPADKMTFVGVNRTDLTRDFVAVDGNDIERGAVRIREDFVPVNGNDIEKGMVRIGGYSMSGIQDRYNGILVELVFQVRESGGEIELIKVVDDLKEFIVIR